MVWGPPTGHLERARRDVDGRQRGQPGRVAARPRPAGRHRPATVVLPREVGAAPARRPGAPVASSRPAARSTRRRRRPEPRRPDGRRRPRPTPSALVEELLELWGVDPPRCCGPAASACASCAGPRPSSTLDEWPAGAAGRDRARRRTARRRRRRSTTEWAAHPGVRRAGWTAPFADRWLALAAGLAAQHPGARAGRHPGRAGRRWPRSAPTWTARSHPPSAPRCCRLAALPAAPRDRRRVAARPGCAGRRRAAAAGCTDDLVDLDAARGRRWARRHRPARCARPRPAAGRRRRRRRGRRPRRGCCPSRWTTCCCRPTSPRSRPGRWSRRWPASLRLVADVESTGGATVYRFTEASVRRALDAGLDRRRPAPRCSAGTPARRCRSR